VAPNDWPHPALLSALELNHWWYIPASGSFGAMFLLEAPFSGGSCDFPCNPCVLDANGTRPLCPVTPMSITGTHRCDTMENSVRSTHPLLAGCSSMECLGSISCWLCLVLAFVPMQCKPVCYSPAVVCCLGSVIRWASFGLLAFHRCPDGLAAVGVLSESYGLDGMAHGGGYCSARGEILRSLQDQLQRWHSASAHSFNQG